MKNTRTFTITAFIALALALPCAVFADGEAIALGQAVELTGGALPQQIRDITGIGTGASSWDYLSQKITYGYFVETYSHFDALAKAKVDRRNGVEDLVTSSYKSGYNANAAIADVKFNQDYAQHVMQTEFAQRSGRGTQIANTYTMNTYLPHSDGSVEYFKDGLLARVDNQRSIDEFGNASFKNIYNFVYDQDRRLMMSHEYDRTDSMGNKTHGTFSCSYTADSVFYGCDQTNANKNYQTYTTTEIDHTGRVTTMTWKAGTYEGKYLRDFAQTTIDAIPGKGTGTSTRHCYNIQYSAPGQMSSFDEEGVANHVEGELGSDVLYTYKLHRSDITYIGGQIASYEDTRWDMDPDASKWSTDLSKWTKTTSKITMEYVNAPVLFGADVNPDQSRIQKQTVASKVENPDGSYRNETAITEYQYDANYKLAGSTGSSTFNGLASDSIAYTDKNGHTLSKKAKYDSKGDIMKDAQGRKIYEYSYVDSSNNAVIVATGADAEDAAFKALVTATTTKGSQYAGTSTTTYEIFNGMPVAKETISETKSFGTDNKTVVASGKTTVAYTYDLVNNMVKLLKTVETTVSTQPALDAKGEYPTTRTVTTTYTYNTNGYLDKVEGNGTSKGRDYSEDKGFATPYTSVITVTYDIKLDRPIEHYTDEKFDYDNTPGTETKPSDNTKPEDNTTPIDMSSYTTSEALMTEAWKYYNAIDMSKATQFLSETIKRYGATAVQQQASLSGFAAAGSESKSWALNDVATAEYLLGEIAMKAGNNSLAKTHFQTVINTYGFAQCWDTKGWYWHVVDAAKKDLASI